MVRTAGLLLCGDSSTLGGRALAMGPLLGAAVRGVQGACLGEGAGTSTRPRMISLSAGRDVLCVVSVSRKRFILV